MLGVILPPPPPSPAPGAGAPLTTPLRIGRPTHGMIDYHKGE